GPSNSRARSTKEYRPLVARRLRVQSTGPGFHAQVVPHRGMGSNSSSLFVFQLLLLSSLRVAPVVPFLLRPKGTTSARMLRSLAGSECASHRPVRENPEWSLGP